MLAVFDGAGGASYAVADGESRTGAFLASRLGKKTLLDFFEERLRQSQPFAADSTPKRLEELFKTNFKTELAGLQSGAVTKPTDNRPRRPRFRQNARFSFVTFAVRSARIYGKHSSDKRVEKSKFKKEVKTMKIFRSANHSPLNSIATLVVGIFLLTA